ncbi:MAG: sigma-70 family RNA polymerase sigma factor [Bacteroidota bacterium]
MSKTSIIENEIEVIEKAKKNLKQFEPLYNKYFEPVFRFAFQRLSDEETAYDITSQVFIKAMTRIQQYKHQGFAFSSWLYRIALNEITDFYRANKNARNINISDGILNVIVDDADLSKEEQYQFIENAISKLSETDFLLIEMRFFENRSYKEIGEILKLTDVNAKIKTYRILDKIKLSIPKHLMQ